MGVLKLKHLHQPLEQDFAGRSVCGLLVLLITQQVAKKTIEVSVELMSLGKSFNVNKEKNISNKETAVLKH